MSGVFVLCFVFLFLGLCFLELGQNVAHNKATMAFTM